MQRKNGFDLKAALGHSHKDWHFEGIFGSAANDLEITPLNRKVLDIPVVYQGQVADCVPSSITWAQQSHDGNVDLSHEFLASLALVDPDKGSAPQPVLEAARKNGICEQVLWKKEGMELNAAQHKLPGYSRISDLSPRGIYSALQKGFVIIGVPDWEFAGPHMMTAYDVDPDKQVWKAVSWSQHNEVDLVEVPWDDVVYATLLLKEKPEGVKQYGIFLSSLLNVTNFVHSKGKFILLGLLALLTGGIAAGQIFGASGTYARFSTTISSGVDYDATTIPISSVSLKSGETIGQAGDSLHFPMYFTLNPEGTAPEDIEVWGMTTGTTPSLDSVVRGITYLGGNTTTTVSALQVPHSAGERVILSNTPAFFNRFVDRWTTQGIDGAKTFLQNLTVGAGSGIIKYIFDIGQGSANPFLYANGTSTVGWSPNGTDTFQFNDSGTVLGASSTRAIGITDSEVHLNIGGSNLSFYDGNLVTYTTGMAGEDINALSAVVVSSTASDQIYETNTANVFNTSKFIGFAVADATSGNTVYIASPGSKLCGFSSLQSGAYYYLNGSSGSIATSTPEALGAVSHKIKLIARVALALSSSCIRIIPPRYVARGFFKLSATAAVGTKENIITGFYPASVRVIAGPTEPDYTGIHTSIGVQYPPESAWAQVMNSSSTGDWYPGDIPTASDSQVPYLYYVTTSTNVQVKNSVGAGEIYDADVTADGFSITHGINTVKLNIGINWEASSE